MIGERLVFQNPAGIKLRAVDEIDRSANPVLFQILRFVDVMINEWQQIDVRIGALRVKKQNPDGCRRDW